MSGIDPVNLRRSTSSLLSLLLVLLIALGPLPLLAGYPNSDGCYTTAESNEVETHGCCDANPDGSRIPSSCSDQRCSAAQCSTLSFLPSAGIPAHGRQPSTDAAAAHSGHAPHRSTPATPPPIIIGLS